MALRSRREGAGCAAQLDVRADERSRRVSLETACHRGPAVFDELRIEWMTVFTRSASPSIFLAWQWQSAWWQAFGSGYDLFVLTHRSEQGRLLGICPLYRKRLGSGASVLRLVGGIELCDYLDMLHVAGFEAAGCAATVEYLLAHEDEWDVLDLHCLPADSPTRELLPALFRQRGYEAREVVEEECPILILPETWEEYLAGLSSKQRHELRRKMRRAAEVAALGIEHITSERELPGALEDFFSLHRQSGLEKEAFLTPQVREFFTTFAPSLFEAGWLDLCFLVAEGKRVASLLCFDWNDQVYVYNSGFDRRYRSLSVGIVLLGRYIESAIARGKKRVDFLRGREKYKFQLGAQARPIYRLTVHKGTLPPDLG